MATRRQRQKQRQKSGSLTDRTDASTDHDHDDDALDESEDEREGTSPGVDRRTRFERFIDVEAGQGEDQTSSRWLAFVLGLSLLPPALGLLLAPLFGPKRLSLEPLEREITKGAPFLAAAAVVAFVVLFLLARWFSLPRNQWRFFALCGLAWTGAFGLAASDYYNARYDHESGYVQSNYRKQAGEGTWAPWIKTILAKDVYVPAATYRLGCDDHEGTHRCRFRVRGGALGLKWAEPEPMPPGEPLVLARPFGSDAPAVSVTASVAPSASAAPSEPSAPPSVSVAPSASASAPNPASSNNLAPK